MKQDEFKNSREDEFVLEEEEECCEEDYLTPREKRALEALLMYPKLDDAARAAGISNVTMWRYMKKPRFKRRWREAANACLSHTAIQLSQDTTEALAVLRSEMRNEESPRRVQAARAILDYADRLVGRVNDEERMDEIEEHTIKVQEERIIIGAMKEGY